MSQFGPFPNFRQDPACNRSCYGVWFPNQRQYYSFNTQSEAQSFVRGGSLGVVINPQGGYDGVQPWSGASQYAAVRHTPVFITPPPPPPPPLGPPAPWPPE